MTSDTAEKEKLRALSLKYGIAMLALFFNRIFAMPLLWQAVKLAGLIPNADGDARYIALMLTNEAASYLLPLTAFAFLFGGEARGARREIPYPRLKCGTLLLFICGIGVGSLGSLISDGLTSLTALIFGTQRPTQAFSDSMPTNGTTFAALIFCTCVIAPICEEFIFRHLLLRPLRKYGDMTAAVTASLMFGLYHANPDQLAYTTLVGFFLAVIAVRSDSIKPTITAHIINNLTVGLVNYLPESFGSAQADFIFKSAEGVISAAVNVAIVIGLALMLLPPVRRTLKLRCNCGMTQREQAVCLCSEPVVIAGMIAMIAAFFI